MIDKGETMVRLFSVMVAICLVSACATSPTGKTQLRLLPESQMAEMGDAAYTEIKQQTSTVRSDRLNQYVRCVATAITQEVAPGTNWDINLFQDPSANAFALPGRHLGVNTGILKVAQNQHQLATVIGHEVAHVQANHANARISTAYATQAGLALAQVLAGTASTEKQQLLGLLGVGAQVGVLLPYGRSQESEADILGLEYMARAGFDPRQSIDLWQNMARGSRGQPPEFLSTHPSHSTRIEQLNAQMSKALALYEQARARGQGARCESGR
jgi:predicted Zn-dependent protease